MLKKYKGTETGYLIDELYDLEIYKSSTLANCQQTVTHMHIV